MPGQQYCLEDLLSFLDASQINKLRSKTGATTLEELSLLTEDDWDKVDLGLVPKRRIRNVLQNVTLPQQMVRLPLSAPMHQQQIIPGPHTGDINGWICELQGKLLSRIRFWPYAKMEHWDGQMEYSTLRSSIPIVGREQDEKMILDRWKENFECLFDSQLRPVPLAAISKVQHAVKQVVITGAPGTGKTTVGERCKGLLKKCLNNRIKNPIYLRASFADVEAAICPADDGRTGSTILGMRLLWYFLFVTQSKKICWQMFQECVDDNVAWFGFNNVLRFIVNQHRSLQTDCIPPSHTPPSSPLKATTSGKQRPIMLNTSSNLIQSVVVHIDEINNLIARNHQKLFDVIQTLGRASFQLAQQGIFLAIIVTGTGARESLEAVFDQDLSSFKGSFFHLSLPTAEQIEQSVIEDWAAKGASTAWKKCRGFRNLIQAVVPLPRAVELLLRCMWDKNGRDGSQQKPFKRFFDSIYKQDFVAIIHRIANELAECYDMLKWLEEDNVGRTVLTLSFSGVVVPKTCKIATYTLSELENKFGVVISYGKDGETARVDLPFVIATRVNDIPELQVLSPDEYKWLTLTGFVQGTEFEDLDGINEELRSAAFRYLGKTSLTVAEYYYGALGKKDTLSHKIDLHGEHKFIKPVQQFCHCNGQFAFWNDELPCRSSSRPEVEYHKWADGYIIHTGMSSQTGDLTRILRRSRTIIIKQNKLGQLMSNPQLDHFYKEVHRSYSCVVKTFRSIVQTLEERPAEQDKWHLIFVFVCNGPLLHKPDINKLPTDTLIFYAGNISHYYSRLFMSFIAAEPQCKQISMVN